MFTYCVITWPFNTNQDNWLSLILYLMPGFFWGFRQQMHLNPFLSLLSLSICSSVTCKSSKHVCLSDVPNSGPFWVKLSTLWGTLGNVTVILLGFAWGTQYHIFEYWSQFLVLFEDLEDRGTAGGRMLLRMGFKGLQTCSYLLHCLFSMWGEETSQLSCLLHHYALQLLNNMPR